MSNFMIFSLKFRVSFRWVLSLYLNPKRTPNSLQQNFRNEIPTKNEILRKNNLQNVKEIKMKQLNLKISKLGLI